MKTPREYLPAYMNGMARCNVDKMVRGRNEAIIDDFLNCYETYCKGVIDEQDEEQDNAH